MKDGIQEARSALRPSEAGATDNPSRTRCPAGHCGPERILAVDERSRSGGAADRRGTRHRFRSMESLGVRDSSQGKSMPPRPSTAAPTSGSLPPLHPGGPESQCGSDRSAQRHRKTKNSTPAQIAVAWLLAQKPWIVPIRGTRKLERLDENIGAGEIETTSDDLRKIDSASRRLWCKGLDFPKTHMKSDRPLRAERVCLRVASQSSQHATTVGTRGRRQGHA